MPSVARWSVAVLVFGSAAWVSPPKDSGQLVTVRGKVLTLPEALKLRAPGLAFDTDPVAKQVVLMDEEGKITPLLSTDTSRALFVDQRLRDCRAEIQGRRPAGGPYLEVITLKVERDGRFQTPEYWCDVCAISVPYPQTCPCCQGPVELRMRPDHR